MAAHKASPVHLSAEHERELNDLVRAHSTPQKLAERARIILLAAAGLGVDETAQRLGIWRKTAGHWRRRWREAMPSAGVAARLSDAPRSGAPARFTPEMAAGSWGLPAKIPRPSTCRSVIGAKANWRGRPWHGASSTVSRTALSGGF